MSDANVESFDYELFGLAVRSEIAIPELRPVLPTGEPDIRIRMGSASTGARITIAGIADFAVGGGREILVRPAGGASPRNVRLYLLGSAMGLLLHQRGLLPLHANAVVIGSEAVAFMGPSGSGKSTLAAWFHDSGHTVVADDVTVVGFADAGPPTVHPGLPRLRLWKQALEASGRNSAHYARSYAGDETWDKFDVPLDLARARAKSRPLRAVYLLDKGPVFDVQSLSGIEAAEAVFANTYRGAYVSTAGEPRLHWEACVRLVRSTPIFRAVRNWGLERLADEAPRLLDHARGLAG